MKITNIREAGNNSTLRWAINAKADIRNDRELISIINDELYYVITIEGVNFFQLFRLTQTYRDKLRILEEHKASIPTTDELSIEFKGSTTVNGEDVAYKDLTSHAISMFANMAMQMYADDDIIDHNNAKMFLPMICREFTIEIPYNFSDIIYSTNIEHDCYNKIFNSEYPNTLENIFEIDPGIANKILLIMVDITKPIKYNKHMNDILKVTKYFPLKRKDNNYYNLGVVDFHKFVNISKTEIRCSLFKLDSEEYKRKTLTLKSLNTPLKIDFAVQLPIQCMQIIENSFSPDDLNIKFESSMSQIIEDGLCFNEFNNSDVDENADGISAYKSRIKECEVTMMNVISIILNTDKFFDESTIFSMLPSIYMTRAIITYDCSKEALYHHSNPVVDFIFNEMRATALSIEASLKK